jgi:hypothetical protein
LGDGGGWLAGEPGEVVAGLSAAVADDLPDRLGCRVRTVRCVPGDRGEPVQAGLVVALDQSRDLG